MSVTSSQANERQKYIDTRDEQARHKNEGRKIHESEKKKRTYDNLTAHHNDFTS